MKLNVAVLFGGMSVEHEVSIISASQAMAALDDQKYTIIPIYQDKQAVFYTGEKLKDVKAYQDMKTLLGHCVQVNLIKDKQHHYLMPIQKTLFSKRIQVDVVIPVVHGKQVEDGSIQGLLESLDIAYAGSNVMASAIGQDKVFMKMAFEHDQIPGVKWLALTQNNYLVDFASVKKQIKKLGYPVIIKPANLGSSIGISKVKDENELDAALDLAFGFDQKLIIEATVLNLREINCSVRKVQDQSFASVLEEVFMKDDILSFKDKYLGSSKSKGMASTSRIIPAPLEDSLTKKVQSLAIACFDALGCDGVARMDFLMDDKTKEVYANEINTIPGSLAFYLWEKSGISFTQLMDDLVQQAIYTYRKKQKTTRAFDSNILSSYAQGSSKGKGSKA